MENQLENHEHYMQLAIEEAYKAQEIDEVPIGCVIVKDGKVISQGYNTRESGKNPLAHAEILAIGRASEKLGAWRLEGCSLYVTLEPCPMCMGAIINSRIEKVFFGAYDKKAGCCGSVVNLNELPFNHKAEVVGGIMENECGSMLTEFFKKLRINKK